MWSALGLVVVEGAPVLLPTQAENLWAAVCRAILLPLRYLRYGSHDLGRVTVKT